MSLSSFALLFCCLSVLPNLRAEAEVSVEAVGANPIRKVITMLQAMQKKVEAEGAKETKLYEKYMCYCKSSGGDLSKSVGDANTKIPQVSADIKESEAKLVQLKSDVKQHQVDRSAAKQAVASATGLREKEAADYAKEASEAGANIAALTKAIAAIENGMAGGFLQTRGASILRQLVIKQEMDEEDRHALNAFLQGSSSEQYAPSSGEITGILKTLNDEMSKEFAEAKSAEQAAIAAFDGLVAAKTKEINALTHGIETKMLRTGELSVEIVQMKNDLTDTQQALEQDTAFLADMKKNCAKKTEEWDAIVKTRGDEMVALSETIKILGDDDALEIFKKSLPSASASFVQTNVNTASAHARALALILSAKKRASAANRPQLDFIFMAINGKKMGFEKVIKMVDQMVATLKEEQLADDHKREYCAKSFDLADDKKRGLERAASDLETAIEEAKEGIAATKSEIEAMRASIKALDTSVAEATSQRKEENEDFTELMAQDSAARELLGFAKKRLNKFYNPKLAALSQVRAHSQDIAAPAAPPAAPGAYQKKTEESGGVIAMIDLLIADLQKQMTEAKTEEKNSQGDYEVMMKDSASKRADDAKTLANKQGALANMQASLETSSEEKTATSKELAATAQYIGALHGECDWLLKYFDVRKEARDSEIDSLGNAKAVLRGADFSLVQMKSQKSLRGA